MGTLITKEKAECSQYPREVCSQIRCKPALTVSGRASSLILVQAGLQYRGMGLSKALDKNVSSIFSEDT